MNIPDALINDLKKIIGYSYSDEEECYQLSRLEGEDTDDHIFESIKRLADWLDNTSTPPPDPSLDGVCKESGTTGQ